MDKNIKKYGYSSIDNISGKKFNTESLFNFNPKAENKNGEWISLQPLGTEGQGTTQFPDRKKYSLIQFAIPIGGGVKFAVSEHFNIILEYGIRKTFTDYLDDVGGTYADPQYLAMEDMIAAQLSDRTIALQDFLANNPTADITVWSQNTDKQRANPNGWNDWYTFAGITLSFKIVETPKVCQF